MRAGCRSSTTSVPSLDGRADVGVLLDRDVGRTRVAEVEQDPGITDRLRPGQIGMDQPPEVSSQRDPQLSALFRARRCSSVDR